jgi:hypothetical protein
MKRAKDGEEERAWRERDGRDKKGENGEKDLTGRDPAGVLGSGVGARRTHDLDFDGLLRPVAQRLLVHMRYITHTPIDP